MTSSTTSPVPSLDEQNGSEGPKSPSKPLARTRSPTPPVDEPSRKRRRPESPSSKESRGHNSETTSDTLESNKTDLKVEKSALPASKQLLEDSPNNGSAKDLPSRQENEEEGEEEEREEGEEEEEQEEEEEAEEGELPPLPPGPPPEEPPSDGWEAIWDPSAGQYYFYNHHTGETTWTNPRVPPTEVESAPTENVEPERSIPYTGYDPAVHGDYDPTASYAQRPERTPSPTIDPYVVHAAFNRFTGKFQNGPGTERHTDESRAKRQMEIYFDVDAAANCHDGRSLKAERQAKKLTKKEVKAFREKTRLKKEEKKRAWLRD